jgi:hypothetical protein
MKTIRDYIDITESNQHHVNQKPFLTDWEIEKSYYIDYSKHQLLIDTCNLCYSQNCWVHDSRYPVQKESKWISTDVHALNLIDLETNYAVVRNIRLGVASLLILNAVKDKRHTKVMIKKKVIVTYKQVKVTITFMGYY